MSERRTGQKLDWRKAARPLPQRARDAEDEEAERSGRRLQAGLEDEALQQLVRRKQQGQVLVAIGRGDDLTPQQNRDFAYATPLYCITPDDEMENTILPVLICHGWDHLERAERLAAKFNKAPAPESLA